MRLRHRRLLRMLGDQVAIGAAARRSGCDDLVIAREGPDGDPADAVRRGLDAVADIVSPRTIRAASVTPSGKVAADGADRGRRSQPDGAHPGITDTHRHDRGVVLAPSTTMPSRDQIQSAPTPPASTSSRWPMPPFGPSSTTVPSGPGRPSAALFVYGKSLWNSHLPYDGPIVVTRDVVGMVHERRCDPGAAGDGSTTDQVARRPGATRSTAGSIRPRGAAGQARIGRGPERDRTRAAAAARGPGPPTRTRPATCSARRHRVAGPRRRPGTNRSPGRWRRGPGDSGSNGR